ncbi:hypothetical protein IFO70_36220 [Phormidium tenue FACHB-886]|nr:hypothetical protein [Phormidium tenue FACHB-886]
MVRPTTPTAYQHQRSAEVSSDRQSAERTLSESALSDSNEAPLGRHAVGFFSNLSDTEYAVTGLKSVGFPLSQITLVANHFRRQDQFVGADLQDSFEGVRLKISTEQAHFYRERLNCGKYMVIMQGTEDELNCAASIFNHRGIEDWQIYGSTSINN